ncbi:tRNA1(Val) (adenine(37)-N6)-methyltransferase [Cognatiyoonia koreensis]|uniref:tRNA1(Val) (adenine(37)-N6)-methyltransferase n=1 Tax=Cognatiyoonia koreensis TaxID=364200 RepID=UPI001F61B1ED|nr:methyltransferase [Cognatiyoonia koreensis]
MDADLTHDAFLGGLVHIWQPKKGYRAGTDPVMLAASVPAQSGQSVLELGCGAGTAALCLHTRVAGLRLVGVEVQSLYATLAARNAAGTSADMRVITSDLRDLPADLRQERFDHVIMNPPYFDRAKGDASADQGRDLALGGDTPLADWLGVGIRRVGPKGYLTVIQKIDRLPDVMAAIRGRLGSFVLRPIASTPTSAANLFLLRARQEGHAPMRICPPLIMHDGNRYTPEVEAILRNAAELSMDH